MDELRGSLAGAPADVVVAREAVAPVEREPRAAEDAAPVSKPKPRKEASRTAPAEKDGRAAEEAAGADTAKDLAAQEADTDPMPTGVVRQTPAGSAFPASIIPADTPAMPEEDFSGNLPTRQDLGQPPPPVVLPPMSDPGADAAPIDDGLGAGATAGEETQPAANTPAAPSASAEPQADTRVQREAAIEGLNRPGDQTPYAAVGVRMGTFVLKPSLDTGITATSNADSSVNGSSATLSETTVRLNAVSDWSSHQATIDAFGTFRKTLSGQDVEDVEGGVDAGLLLDLGNEYRARGTVSYSAAPESAASPVVIANAVEEPLTQRLGGTLGLEKDAGKARFSVTGGVARSIYGDADLEGGGVLSQKDRDANLYTLAVRAGYEISPALTPFLEGEIGRNEYDMDVDAAGYRRSSDRWAMRAGLAFDRGEKLSGEIAAGWMREEFDDSRLSPLSAPSLRGEVLWSPLRGTNVRLTGSTILEGTTTPGQSGSVLYASSLSVERQMRANLTGTLGFGAARRDYDGSDGQDTILNAEASLTWWLNRYAGLTGRLRHETVSSTLPDRDTETNSVFIGLRVQR